MPTTSPTEFAGLHNVLRVSDRIISGSSPDGEDGFRSMERLGVRTVISVDGARPDVETARKFGLRYVHLPVGYDGIPRGRALQIARAARDLPGPIYIHCHHGKHRGPAAAAAAQLSLDANCRAEEMEAFLKTAGTDPRYTGLVGLPRSLVRPTAAELDRAPAEFPEVSAVPDLARLMVAIDARWDNMKLVKAAGWAAPKDHPDIDPPHEVLQLVELYREASRVDGVTQRGPEFAKRLSDAEASAGELERALRENDAKRAEAAFARSNSTCTSCHAQFRDRPIRP
jgi:protein tyrosine phosphatase (PTP) superfamily phosphohydrolase (DUF442 family)